MGLRLQLGIATILISLGLLVPRLLWIVQRVDLIKGVTYPTNSQNCKVVDKDSTGKALNAESMEDIIYIKDKVFLTTPKKKEGKGEEADTAAAGSGGLAAFSCSADFFNVWHVADGFAKAQNGDCFMVRNSAPNDLIPIPLIGFPRRDVAFHAHGMYYTGFDTADAAAESGGEAEEEFLFIVNHAYRRGGERIDSFKLQRDADTGLLTGLVYQGTLGQKWMSSHVNGIANDLVVDISRRTVYFSQYLDVMDAPSGRGNPETFQQAHPKLMLYWAALSGTFNTKLWRCSLPSSFPADLRTKKEAERHFDFNNCAPVVEGKLIANGVQHYVVNYDKKNLKRLLFLVDALDKTVSVYSTAISTLSSSSGSPDSSPLILVDDLKLKHAADNIEFSRLPIHEHPWNDHQDATELGFTFFLGSIVNVTGAGEISEKRDYTDEGALTLLDFTLKFNQTAPSGFSLLNPEANRIPFGQKDVVVHSNLQAGTASGIMLMDTAAEGGKLQEGGTAIMGSWRDKGMLICPLNAPEVEDLGF